MTTCHTFSERLVELVSGQLPATEASSLRAHGAECDTCATQLRREQALSAALADLPPVPAFEVPEPQLPVAPILELPVAPERRWWANARLSAAVALVSAAAMLWAVQLSGGLEPIGTTADQAPEQVRRAVPVEIRTVLASESTAPELDDDFLALTAGVEAVIMRRPAQDRCANGLCAADVGTAGR